MTVSAILLTILLAFLSDELLMWSPKLAEWLVRRSVRHLPPQLRDRMLEEWLADVEDSPGRISKVLIGLDTHRATAVIGHEFRLPHISYWSAVLVRFVDVCSALFQLALQLPLLAIAAIAVCVEKKGRGPIFVRQLRVGQDARPFYLIKFATDKQIGPIEGDRQLTKVGKVLCATGIESFPILVNILKGDMSFVGPNPELPTDIVRMSKFVEGYDELFAVKPGITGYAQIHNPYGRRHDDINRKHDHDVAYIRHYGLRMYFRILFHTVKKTLSLA